MKQNEIEQNGKRGRLLEKIVIIVIKDTHKLNSNR